MKSLPAKAWRRFRSLHIAWQVGFWIFAGVLVISAGSADHKSSRDASVRPPTTSMSKRTTPSTSIATTTVAIPSQTSSSPVTVTPSYPPASLVEVRALANEGDKSQAKVIRTYDEGLPNCPIPNVEVVVAPALGGKALAADLLAAYAANLSFTDQCGAALFAYHDSSEVSAGNGYTAGRVFLDPVGRDGKHSLEVDTGTSGDTITRFIVNY